MKEMQEAQVQSLGQENPLLPGKFYRQRSLVCYRPWGHKDVDMTE